MVPAWVSLFDAILGLAFVATGLAGSHFRLLPPLFGASGAFLGFQIFLLGFFFGLLAVGFGLIAIFFTPAAQRGEARPRALLGAALGLAIALPVLVAIIRNAGYPRINDVTTDLDNPPEFAYAPRLGPNQGRNLRYDKAKWAAAQRGGFAGLAPFKMAGDPSAVFERVRAAASTMPDWQITYVEARTHTLEGVATTSLFRFQDDFVIQVRPGAGGASLVEMRSRSRDGSSDFGANYRRITAFFARLAAAP